jgi:hypothetical protein
MNNTTIQDIQGQGVTFSDSSYLQVPFELTPKHNGTNITLLLDSSRRMFTFDLDVSKSRFIMCVNIMLIDSWRLLGKQGKPKQIPYEST